MTGHIVVGYTATKTGRDAVAFAARLAAATDAVLDVAIVLPSPSRSVITPPDAAYDRYLHEQAQRWIAGAIDRIPADVVGHAHVRTAESFAEGLVQLAGSIGADYVVVGAADGASRGRHRLGSTTTELLHSSDVPVVLVPRGARKVAAETGLSRVTVAIGTRPGADALIGATAELAERAGVPVRLLSLLPVDLPPSADTAAIRLAGSTEAEEVLEAAAAELPAGLAADVVVASGDSIEDAVSHLEWQGGEVLLVGSSRLAQPRRLFLGSTAAKMLHEVTVPVIVVPRTTRTEEARG
ncbi:universal stress protein [Microbacterium dextranolyticum]|uniref:Universal stress protein UspA n=1 Tax=Microbacterium dextranolyticum TaxID=36806 RepID=A0A9W6M549_9MICO|nr:universal stress protein [Microbacterium dextranolyticum]MBM7462220.1 nucleotide-binding universal stress UspA family protein [Microbacterium dextranolyticum]GLJ94471.1 universal stress protein UspA [Microbacterium dextranolyticum]